MITPKEISARLDDLGESPRKGNARFALMMNPSGGSAAKVSYISLFRPHWESAVYKPREIEFRESLDESLDYLELMELAIETGYIPAKSIRQTMLHELAVLLSSPAAQQYLLHYDYLLVRFLAARYEFPLRLPALQAPEPNSDGELRFAALLSTYNELKSDGNLKLFTQLLDDFTFADRIDAKFLRARLLSNRKGALPPEEEDVVDKLSEGLDHFVQQLGGLFLQSSKNERPYFGSFFAYWLAKFFGYVLVDEGYRETAASWEPAVLALYSSKSPDDSLAGLRSLRIAQLKAMQETGEAARNLVQKMLTPQHSAKVFKRADLAYSEMLPGYQALTPRERDVLHLVAMGKPIKKVAAELKLGAKTVQGHRDNILKKLKLRSAVDLRSLMTSE